MLVKTGHLTRAPGKLDLGSVSLKHVHIPVIFFNINVIILSFCSRKACEIHFKDNPIKIVRGHGTYLYDEQGNRYLDCINNVTHGLYQIHGMSLYVKIF